MDSGSRARRILTVVTLTFVANLFVAAVKIGAGLLLGLMALTASGLESLLDATNNIVGFVGVSLSARRADLRHPYGHRKFETFVALIIAFMMFLAGTQIILSGIERLKGGSVPEVSQGAYFAIIFSMLASLVVSFTEWRFGRIYLSEFLLADAAHTLTDFFASAVVLVSIVLVSAGMLWADFAAAIAVVAIIFFVGFKIIREAFTILVDTTQIDPRKVEFCCIQVNGVKAVHKIRSRGTPDAVKVDLHIKVKSDLPISEANALSHEVKDKLMKEFTQVDDVIVHIEPWYGS